MNKPFNCGLGRWSTVSLVVGRDRGAERTDLTVAEQHLSILFAMT